MGDDGGARALCCTKFDPEKMSMCDKCSLQYCTDCIDTLTRIHVAVSQCFVSATVKFSAHKLLILRLYLVDN